MQFNPSYRLPDFTRSGSIFPTSTARKETPATPLARDVRGVSSGAGGNTPTASPRAAAPAMPPVRHVACGNVVSNVRLPANNQPGGFISRATLPSNPPARQPASYPPAGFIPRVTLSSNPPARQPASYLPAGFIPRVTPPSHSPTPTVSGARTPNASTTTASLAKQSSPQPRAPKYRLYRPELVRPDRDKYVGRSNAALNGNAIVNGKEIWCRHFAMALGMDAAGKGVRLADGKPAFARLSDIGEIAKSVSSLEHLAVVKTEQRDVSLIANQSFSAFVLDKMASIARQPAPYTQKFVILTQNHAMYLELGTKVDDTDDKVYGVLRFYDPNNTGNWLTRTEIRKTEDVPQRFSDLFQPYDGSQNKRLDLSSWLKGYGFPPSLDNGHVLAYALPGEGDKSGSTRFKAFEPASVPAGTLSADGYALCLSEGVKAPIQQTQRLQEDPALISKPLGQGLSGAIFYENRAAGQALARLLNGMPSAQRAAMNWTELLLAKNSDDEAIMEDPINRRIRLPGYLDFISQLSPEIKSKVNWSHIMQSGVRNDEAGMLKVSAKDLPAVIQAKKQFIAEMTRLAQQWNAS